MQADRPSLCTSCAEFFHVLIVASPGPYARDFIYLFIYFILFYFFVNL